MGLLSAAHRLIEFEDGCEQASKMKELSDLIHRAAGPAHLRSAGKFAVDPEAMEVLGWLRRELPRCMGMVPPRRYPSFLRGVYRYVFEEANHQNGP
ncbi:MAG: hypothetical protein U0790_29770 [Isosphaeraceae bacterium]